MKELEKILEERGIPVTAMRLLIFKAMLEHRNSAFSLSDLEAALDTVDKSTLSRTTHLFHDKHLIHSIDDGSGAIKYSICSDDCQCIFPYHHVHFHCLRCKETYCLEAISVPKVQLPQNFLLNSVNFVLKGYCDKCAKFATQLH